MRYLPPIKKLMKHFTALLLGTAFTGFASAQTPAAPPVIIEETVTETIPANPAPAADINAVQRRVDAALARERLGAAPVVIPRQERPVVETTTETTTIETPGQPTRVYSTKRNVVLVEGRELPYLTIPVLFVEGTADLLDRESRLAIEDTALAIKEVLIANPTAVFDVEGHTSTDGADEMNLQLSAERAKRIYTELITSYGVPTTALAAHGYGENFAQFPNGSENQMILDRRVLVVRVR